MPADEVGVNVATCGSPQLELPWPSDEVREM
jgi:hypothetical protein